MARQMMDIGKDANGDLLMQNGDFAIVESTAAHQVSLVADAPGEYPYAPLVGVGAINYIDGNDLQGFLDAISSQFTQDGMDVQGVTTLDNGNVDVEAYYK